MEPTFEKRLSDMESIVNDIPGLLNLRLERFNASFFENSKRFDEINGRLNLIDKQMSLMVTDLRDLRSGVTNQLMAQDQVIREIKTELAVLKTMVEGRLSMLDDRMARVEGHVASLDDRMARVEGHVASLQGHVASLDDRMARIEDRMARIEGHVAGLDDRMASLEKHMASVAGEIGKLGDSMHSMDHKLDLILVRLSKA